MILRRTLARRLLEIAALSVPVARRSTSASSSGGGICGNQMPPPPQQVCIDPASLADAGIEADAGTFMNGCPTGPIAAEAAARALGYADAQIISGPTNQGSMCCYEAQEILLCLGRPFL